MELNEKVNVSAQKIQDSNVRKELIEQAENAKVSTGKLTELLGKQRTSKPLANETIAKLNDIAYRPLKKKPIHVFGNDSGSQQTSS